MIGYLDESLREILYKKFNLDDKTGNYERRLKRYNHSISVMEFALVLSEKYNYENKEKVLIASLLHDYAKFESFDRYSQIVNKYNLSKELLNEEYTNVRHALLGSYIIQEELGITDEEILNAIKYHATGKSNMTTLEKIVFISDYAETSRIGEMFEKVRAASFRSLDEAVLIECELSIENIKKRNLHVVGETLNCLEYYKNRG